MDLWTDLNLDTEWGLDSLVQPNGLFGDLTETGRFYGDMDPVQKPRDAVEQQNNSPMPEEPLGIDWMESDLGSFLDAIDNGQDKILSLGEELLVCSQELDSKDNISLAKSLATLPSFVSTDQVEGFIHGFTPPESPEQVLPVIEINNFLCAGDPSSTQLSENFLPTFELGATSNPTYVCETQDFYVEQDAKQDNFLPTIELDVTSSLSPSYETQDFFLEETDAEPEFFNLSIVACEGENTETVKATIVKDISENVSSVSSSKPNIESIIQSSPELYKVIATPNLSPRFSPYKKVKGESKSKNESKSVKSVKLASELVPEEIVTGPVGKKERKKLQNKNAAIRYRQKKKMEVQTIGGEVQDLESKNQDLKTKVDDLQREIKYMKNLMEDIYRAKGLIQ